MMTFLFLVLVLLCPSVALAGGVAFSGASAGSTGVPACFLIAGQSNMFTNGSGSTQAQDDLHTSPNSHSSKWWLFTWDTQHPLTHASITGSSAGTYSPWVSFANEWQRVVGATVEIFVAPVGASCLTSDDGDDADCGVAGGENEPHWKPDHDDGVITGFADRGDSKHVTVTSIGHDRAVSSYIQIVGTTNYNDTFRVVSVPTVDTFDIVAVWPGGDDGAATWIGSRYNVMVAKATTRKLRGCLRAVLWGQGECEMRTSCSTAPSTNKDDDMEDALGALADRIWADLRVPTLAVIATDYSGLPGGVCPPTGAPSAGRQDVRAGIIAAIAANAHLYAGPDVYDLELKADCSHFYDVKGFGERWVAALQAAGLAY